MSTIIYLFAELLSDAAASLCDITVHNNQVACAINGRRHISTLCAPFQFDLLSHVPAQDLVFWMEDGLKSASPAAVSLS
jgi:hypothetical protein